MKFYSLISLLFVMLLSACSKSTPPPQVEVASTQMPVPTVAPVQAAPEPTLVQFPRGNVFCEYEFCIGHSEGLYYYDPAAERVQTNYFDAGILLSCCSAKSDSFLVWQSVSKDLWDPGSDIEKVVGVGLEKRSEPGLMVINGYDVTYQPVQDPQASTGNGWPYGVLASWHCGKRGFLLSLMFDSEVDAVAQMEKQIGAFQCFE